jgi:hypothetical protein
VPETNKPVGGRGVWLFVLVGFGLLGLAWSAMFFFASKSKVQSVPLEHRAAP